MAYIQNKELSAARQHLLSRLPGFSKTEIIPVTQAVGRVLSRAVMANKSSPHYNSAAMDGIAVTAKDTAAARPHQSCHLSPGQFCYINTGAPLEAPYDAVVMIEDVIGQQTDDVRLITPASAWQYVRQVGEDIVKGEMILPGGAKLRPIDIGALLAGGVSQVEVFCRPQVAIIPTGSEIVARADQSVAGQITDSNSPMVAGLLSEWGAEPVCHPPVPDDPEQLRQVYLSLLEQSDMVLILAGSSAGGRDYTRRIIEASGGEILEHGIAIKPGKPSILALHGDKPIIGLPGYPVSCFLSCRLFVRAIIYDWLRQPMSETIVQARLARDVMSSLKYLEYVRLSLGLVNQQLIATPLPGGAGSTMSLVQCDGLGIIPRQSEGLRQGDWIDVELLSDAESWRDKLVVTGSHDLSLDLLADRMALQSSHVGSLGGILALLDQACHVAPIHLIDADGRYNESWVKRYFPAGGMGLIKGIKRRLGLVVAPGNPLAIESITDLTRVRFINRQTGAGTRLLLDKLLRENNIDAGAISGYDNPRPTHLAVAQAVAAGDADAALASYAAAAAFGLDFIPLALEDYDFLFYLKDVSHPLIQRLIEQLQSAEFQAALERLGGYQLEQVGQIIEVKHD